MQIINVPTGKIIITESSSGKLMECVSLGDYGKEKNVKAPFLGLTKDIEGVPHGELMPLSEKWVITVSTQYGCSMNCKFCDVPKVGPGKNIFVQDILKQISVAINEESCRKTKRLNIHFARMGEPTWNLGVIAAAYNIPFLVDRYDLFCDTIHLVISTMLPRKNKQLVEFLQTWCFIKNDFYKGDAGLQFSINSTNNEQREYLFSGSSLTLEEISEIGKSLPNPIGRKYALNFALANNSIIDGKRLQKLFSPDKFMCKITPLHETNACSKNGLITSNGYTSFTPYKEVEENLIKNGFDTIVFVPSIEEDLGRITCGNAILSGTKPETEYSIVEKN